MCGPADGTEGQKARGASGVPCGKIHKLRVEPCAGPSTFDSASNWSGSHQTVALNSLIARQVPVHRRRPVRLAFRLHRITCSLLALSV